MARDSLKDPNVNHDGWWSSPLNEACRFGQLDVVKLLINDYGIKISSYDNTALCQACEEARIDIVKYIISHPAFDPEKCSKVFNSELDNIEMVRLLFEDKRFNQSLNNNLIDKMRSGRKMRGKIQTPRYH